LIGKNSEDYKKYRTQVIGKMPTLRFLDATPITPQERCSAMSALANVARLNPKDYKQKSATPAISAEKGLNHLKTNTISGTDVGITKHIYVGKHSEGNRFIRDKSL